MLAFRASRAHAHPWARGALAVAALLGLGADAALAQCLPDPPMTGDTVTCSGAFVSGFAVPTGVNDVTVIVDLGAMFTTIGNGVLVNDASTVENRGTLTVNGIDSSAILAGNTLVADRTTVTNAAGGVINANGDNSVGITVGTSADVVNAGGAIMNVDGNRALGITTGAQGNVTNEGGSTINVGGDMAAGVGAGPQSSVTNESGGVVNISGDGAFGLSGTVGSTLRNDGSIVVQGTNSAGLSAASARGQNQSTAVNGVAGGISLDGIGSVGLRIGTNGIATNEGSMTGPGVDAVGLQGFDGAQLNQNGTITLSGTGSKGIDADQNSLAVNSGTITMSGADSAGMSGRDGLGTAASSRVRLENAASGSIVASGMNAAAMTTGRFGRMDNLGTLDVQGTGAIGMRSGLDTIAANGRTIVVSGTDAGGIQAEPFDPTLPGQNTSTFYNVWNRFDPNTGAAGMIVSANPDAGPLIQLGVSSNHMNRVRNDAGAEIRADLTRLGTPDRAIAIRGSNGAGGVDEIVNAGTIEGLIDLGSGNDIFTQVIGGTVVDIAGAATVDGGADMDEIHLSNESAQLGMFAADVFTNFETLRVQGYWGLSVPTPVGIDVMVDPGGTFRVASPTRIESNFGFSAPQAGEANGVLETPVSAASSALSELLSVGGTATLSGGVLDVTVDNGFVGAASVTLLRADTALSGSFDAVSIGADPGLATTLLYDNTANTVTLNLFASPLVGNRAATANYLARIEATSPPADLQSVIDGINGLGFASYRQSLDQLSPEPYDAHTATTLELGNRYTQLMLERPRFCVSPRSERRDDPRTKLPCRERRFEPWAAVYGQLGDRTGEDAHISYSDEGAGLVLGLDHRLSESVLLSGTVGGAYDSLEVDGIGKGRIKTLDLGLYAGYTRGPVRVQGVASYGHGWQTQFRNLRLPTLSRTTDAAWETNRIGARVEAEYVATLGAWDVVPLASVDYTAMLQDGFMETGARPVSLLVDSRTDNIVTLRAGVELTTALHKRDYWTEMLENIDGVWRPSLSVRWRQVVTGYDRDITARFVGDPSGAAGSFTVVGNAPNEGFEIGAGIDWTPRMADRLTFGLRYDVFVWSDVTTQDLVARVRVGF